MSVRNTGAVSSPFPRARKPKLGYHTGEVDEFLRVARRAYDGTPAPGDQTITAESIRLTAFGMQKRGYSTDHVDAALERLEDAFAAQERRTSALLYGQEAWLREARTTAQVIANRLGRPEHHRFERVNPLVTGYRVEDVDRFADKLTRYFRDGWPISVDDVRTVTFRPQRGGYREAQVDLVLDAVVDVMLAVR
ncbi:DivIVA domain-containing protein [Agromyces mediolanus]|uniref:DivIVA domain-containing protein n=1 Tax=Agromyces mediolanus TaxID=41986 RepID=UPI00203FE21D|nr:DivIVA domain-containing protein [Agromyces mediolanus]MCM3657136.1 DivIVA domain-containing protein [Agromyces mediolanus]